MTDEGASSPARERRIQIGGHEAATLPDEQRICRMGEDIAAGKILTAERGNQVHAADGMLAAAP